MSIFGTLVSVCVYVLLLLDALRLGSVLKALRRK